MRCSVTQAVGARRPTSPRRSNSFPGASITVPVAPLHATRRTLSASSASRALEITTPVIQAWRAYGPRSLQSGSYRRDLALKYWPLIWSALARKPAEGLLTVLAVAAGFTLLSLMISMNLTARDIVAHTRTDRLFVDPLFNGDSGPGGLPLAIGEQIAQMDGVRSVATAAAGWVAIMWTRMMVWAYARSPLACARCGRTPPCCRRSGTSCLPRLRAYSLVSRPLPSGASRPAMYSPSSRNPAAALTAGTTWEFHVLGIVPDDPNWSGNQWLHRRQFAVH